MCNCGKKRADFGEAQPSRLSAINNIEQTQDHNPNDVYFEYTGSSALSVTGKISGRRYRFNHPGNIQSIDYRDASGMMALPVLRKVNKQQA